MEDKLEKETCENNPGQEPRQKGCSCEHEHGHHHDHGHDHESDAEDLTKERNRLILAAAGLVLLLILEHIIKLPALENQAVNTLCYAAIYLLAGWPAIKEAFEGIFHGELLGEEFLMVIASLGAFITGENAEAASVMVLYSIGELFQDYAVQRSRGNIQALMDLAPDYANRLTDGKTGAYEKVTPQELAIGDSIVILPGEKIPTDATVLTGTSMIDTSSMTGESVPRTVCPGSKLISGCINGSGMLTARVEKEYADSTVARVMELTETAADRKSKTEDFITKFARVYTPCVVGGAALLAIAGGLISGDFLTWLRRACTFLVISCPCALVISIPLSFFAGIGTASRHGILVKGSNFLEALTHVHTFASDKTGTLTKGQFRVIKLYLPGQTGTNALSCFCLQSGETDAASKSRSALSPEMLRLLRLAATAEYYSDHPIADSIRTAFREYLPEETIEAPEKYESLSGKGISALFHGRRLLAGSAALLEEHGISVPVLSEIGTFVYVAEDQVFVGTLIIADVLKDEAKESIEALKQLGVERTVLLSGDAEVTAEAIASRLGIDEAYGNLLPQDKVKKTEDLLADLPEGKLLLYVGDGINDAPVLARADIGVAMGSLGSDAAIEAADVVIMDDDLNKLPAAIRIAQQTVKLCRQNIVFALGIKALFLILAATGHANMWMAVFADVGVALLCVLNSMRMLRYQP